MAGILLLTGCGSGKEDSVKSIKIGVTLYDQYDTFISELMQTFKSTTLKMESEKGVAIKRDVYTFLSQPEIRRRRTNRSGR